MAAEDAALAVMGLTAVAGICFLAWFLREIDRAIDRTLYGKAPDSNDGPSPHEPVDNS